jgi:hypothetical protein
MTAEVFKKRRFGGHRPPLQVLLQNLRFMRLLRLTIPSCLGLSAIVPRLRDGGGW